MGNHSLPGLTFRIVPANRGPEVGVYFHIPEKQSGPLQYRGNFLGLAAVIARLRIEAIRNPLLPSVTIDDQSFAVAPELFHQGWHMLKNTAHRSFPSPKLQPLLDTIEGVLTAHEAKGNHLIELDLREFPHQNLEFSVIGRNGVGYTPLFEPELVRLFDFLTGQLSADEMLSNPATSPAEQNVFRFGKRLTGTTVVHRFVDGLVPERISCSLTDQPFTVKPEIETLIDRANATLLQNAPKVLTVDDMEMLAPVRLKMRMIDLDSVEMQIAFSLSNSSYRHYAAFAFAELLATFSDEFVPLMQFTRETPDPSQPAPATCSIGVRVLLETADHQLVVAHRSDEVKLNPDVWSVSANEGVRRSLLRTGKDCKDLLTLAVSRAVFNELKIEEHECQRPILLSIYRNAFNQWGAGFAMKTDLEFADVVSRRPAARHNFEHRRLAPLPTSIDDCGRAMRKLGERWYGGALETLCQFFAWRYIDDPRYLTPEKVAAALDAASGGVIMPVDQANPALIPGCI